MSHGVGEFERNNETGRKLSFGIALPTFLLKTIEPQAPSGGLGRQRPAAIFKVARASGRERWAASDRPEIASRIRQPRRDRETAGVSRFARTSVSGIQNPWTGSKGRGNLGLTDSKFKDGPPENGEGRPAERRRTQGPDRLPPFRRKSETRGVPAEMISEWLGIRGKRYISRQDGPGVAKPGSLEIPRRGRLPRPRIDPDR